MAALDLMWRLDIFLLLAQILAYSGEISERKWTSFPIRSVDYALVISYGLWMDLDVQDPWGKAPWWNHQNRKRSVLGVAHLEKRHST
ncbi:hypothetical protein DL89DRAFT_269773 [Linderina pennispora]|uniref:Secreted protein n=1 Tax=Linderina pennispora TaxID=61395 RepID=A0A1Y1W0E9_9FUNG|nr:uncharacterized protein DL89DRAFT_269773 [Linderina pennispora]ORX66736.1 hypothetical protein DL89DRAFT_269773 [Linderina pennispora]